MGLRKNTPAFEGESATNVATAAADTAVIESTATVVDNGAAEDNVIVQQAAVSEADAAAATAAAAKAAQPEPVAVMGTAVAAPVQKQLSAIIGGKFQPALNEYKNVIDPSAMSFDTFPRLTCGLDGFSDDKETELGKNIGLELMSWNERYIVTAADDSDEANALTKYSLDGINLDDGSGLCADYVKVLQTTHGYSGASIKKYYNLYGFLTATSETGDLVAVPAEDRQIVGVQIAPRSVSKFTGFQVEDGVKVSRGIYQPNAHLQLSQVKAKGKVKAYALCTFSRLPAGILAD